LSSFDYDVESYLRFFVFGPALLFFGPALSLELNGRLTRPAASSDVGAGNGFVVF
jgi:hypothetical protein